jgi:hypothetical protein
VSWSSRASGAPRRLLIVAAAALIPALAGCEAGNNAPDLDWHYPTEGVGTVVQGISIRNVFVLGAPNSNPLPAGQSAGLFLALVNNGPAADRLLSVQAPGLATSVTFPAGGVALPVNGVKLFTGPVPQVVLTDLTRTITGGTVVTIVLNFQKAGRVSLRVPVISNSTSYATFSPAPTPTPSTSPAKTTSPKPSGSSSASSTPTPSTSTTS